MNFWTKLIFSFFILSFLIGPTRAVELDRIAIIVDEQIVLESEVEEYTQSLKQDLNQQGREVPSASALRTQVTEMLITESLLTQIAQRMGFVISDAELDETIRGMAQRNQVSVDAMRQDIERTGQSWRSYREGLRKQIVTTEVQRMSVQRRIYMSPQEIAMLVNIIKEQEGSQIEYNLGHMLIRVNDQQGKVDFEQSLEQAHAVMNELQQGANFRDLSVSVSSASNALQGGDMGWLTTNAMPTLFAASIDQKTEKSAIIGPLRSGIGFHILQVHDIRGSEETHIEEVHARHILIQPSVILSDERAKQQLQNIRNQIEQGTLSFEDAAKEHSADIGSAQRGGDLGYTVSDVFVPEFKFRVDTMEPGTISDPFRTEHGWHVVEVLDRRVQDMTEQHLENKARQILYNRKYQEELDIWLQEIRAKAYIEFKE